MPLWTNWLKAFRCQSSLEELKGYRGELESAKQKLSESSEKAFNDAEATLDKLWSSTKALFKDADQDLEDDK